MNNDSLIGIKNIQDAIRYWRSCLDDWGKEPDIDIASHMVGLSTHTDFEKWEGQEGKPETDFSKLWNLVADLEVTTYFPQNTAARNEAWYEVKRLLGRLEDQYLRP